MIYQVLQLVGFVRPPGHLLQSAPSLCFALGVMTLGLEFSFAFFALSPVRTGWCRFYAVIAGLMVQMGILVTMRVGVFTETVIVSMLLFVQPEWLDGEFPWQGRPAPGSDAPWSSLISPGPRLLAFAFLSFHFVAIAWGPFIARRFPPPRWVLTERRLLWLDQPFGLFDVVYDIPAWHVTGTLPDGGTIDVLPVAVPALVPRVAWSFSRWYKFTFKERERPSSFRKSRRSSARSTRGTRPCSSAP